MSAQPKTSRLTRLDKTWLWLASLLAIAGVVVYLAAPPTTTKTTTERNAKARVVKTTIEEEQHYSDALLLGGLGLAVVLVLTALLDGRLKLTAGGVGAEVTAVVAAAAETIGSLRHQVDQTSPEVQAALNRWHDAVARARDPNAPS